MVEAYTASWIEIPWASTWYQYHACRSLYGFVDWNRLSHGQPETQLRRSLYGFVDWNVKKPIVNLSVKVEAYTASWIEISDYWWLYGLS